MKKAKPSLKNLPGTRYWFRVAALGVSGQGLWSDIATKVAPAA